MTKAEYEHAMAEAHGDADEMLSASIQRIQDLEELSEMAEVLLCNSMPMSYCTQDVWDKAITLWRNTKHGVATAEEDEKV